MASRHCFYLMVVGYLACVSTIRASDSTNGPLTERQFVELMQSPLRYEGDAERDADRRPSKILRFSEVADADTILDLYAGGGWYTELFSMAVGAKGSVIAHNDSLTWRFGHKELVRRTMNDRLKNVSRLDEVDITEIQLDAGSVDVAFMGINYHDFFFTHRVRKGKVEVMRQAPVDHDKALKRIKALLKDDGRLIITDHFAKPGSGYQAANDLHRIDPDIVKHHLADAGFELLEEAFYLHNPDDDLSLLVFDPNIRGKTSRFIYKFGKVSSEVSR